MKTLATLAIAAGLAAAGCAGTPAKYTRGDGDFHQIALGMTTAEVQGLLGPPDFSFPIGRASWTAWDWKYVDTWGRLAVMSVTFGPDGRAVAKTRLPLRDKGAKGQS